jgi:hypothetical protein
VSFGAVLMPTDKYPVLRPYYAQLEGLYICKTARNKYVNQQCGEKIIITNRILSPFLPLLLIMAGMMCIGDAVPKRTESSQLALVLISKHANIGIQRVPTCAFSLP